MIEATNSVLQNAPLVRGNSEQISVSDSFAANPDRIQKVARMPQAPYVSPYIHVDLNYDKAVLQLRNGETGDVVDQFPSQRALEAQARKRAEQTVASESQSRAQENNSVNISQQGGSAQNARSTPQAQQSQSGTREPQASSVRQSPIQQQAFVAASQAASANTTSIDVLA